jgi:hypothetical protein
VPKAPARRLILTLVVALATAAVPVAAQDQGPPPPSSVDPSRIDELDFIPDPASDEIASVDLRAARLGIWLTSDEPRYAGTLVGAPGGAFQEIGFETPGGHRPVSLRLEVAGSQGSLGQNVGFNVYRGADDAWVARGVPLEGDPNQRVAIASVSNLRPLPYTVQIFNYRPGTTLDYVLTLDFAPLSGTSQSRGAPVLYAGDRQAAGRVDGLGAGSGDADSAYYLLAYPGHFQPVQISIAFSGSAKEVPRILSSSVGAFLWAGRKLLACSGPSARITRPGTGVVRGTLDFFGKPMGCSVPQSRYQAPSPNDAASLLVVSEARVINWAGAANSQDLGLQIFNYKSSGPPGRVDYSLHVEGLRPAPR